MQQVSKRMTNFERKYMTSDFFSEEREYPRELSSRQNIAFYSRRNQQSAALIQRVYRGYRVRKEFYTRRKAATKISKLGRGFL